MGTRYGWTPYFSRHVLSSFSNSSFFIPLSVISSSFRSFFLDETRTWIFFLGMYESA
jgi:hypothetical protein